jgi:predicted component of type VI protein secretion system
LYIHIPPKEYILALKLLAGREKDLRDCKILLQICRVKTREQTQSLLDRYIPAATQQMNAQEIRQSLDQLFGPA